MDDLLNTILSLTLVFMFLAGSIALVAFVFINLLLYMQSEDKND